ncbi:hypothetical protein [Streptomyces sp. bgisy095]|uniref:hypothetical protein n=1 Tax=unclassified Streptomyces TaxID=2593676 RepID=UPI003D74CCAB
MTPTARRPAPAPTAAAERVTAPARLSYAGGMITGVLPALCAAVLPPRRSAGT